MEKVFDEKKYNKEYKKKHYKQFKAILKSQDLEDLNNLLKEKNINKSEFILSAKKLLERGIMMKKISNEDLVKLIREGNEDILLSENINDYLDMIMVAENNGYTDENGYLVCTINEVITSKKGNANIYVQFYETYDDDAMETEYYIK